MLPNMLWSEGCIVFVITVWILSLGMTRRFSLFWCCWWMLVLCTIYYYYCTKIM